MKGKSDGSKFKVDNTLERIYQQIRRIDQKVGSQQDKK